MYLRRRRRRKNGTEYESWALVESVRTAQGPRQTTVATIGKLPGLDREERIGWEEIGRILDGKPRLSLPLFDKPEDVPSWATVNIKGVQVERLRSFGDVYLALALWKRLRLSEFCAEHIKTGREDIPWSTMACILTLARFCAPSSELQIADYWYGTTALDDLLGVPREKVNDDRLYRALDELLPHKEALCGHLQKRYGELFGSRFDFLFYDITSTYFEGAMSGNAQAKRGYSRDGRPDCVQVTIGLVASKEGLPLAFEVFDGNRTDVTTVEEMVETMEKKYGVAERVWVMDRGMVSEKNLTYMRKRGARYLVGTPKSLLRKFERELLEKDWKNVRPDVEIRLCPSPDGGEETYVLCRSQGRKDKEQAILNRFVTRIEEGLQNIREQANSGTLRDKQKALLRIGKLLGKNSRAASLYEIDVKEAGSGKTARLIITVRKNEERYNWALATSGSYILRTNWPERDPEELWKTYMELTQVEDAFRTTKSDLGMRPIFHHKKDRTQAHILVCFISLAMWRMLSHWMSCSGIGSAPRKLLEELRAVKSLDVLLPTRDKTLRLRVVSRAPKDLQPLLQRLKLPLPNRPKKVQDVVPTFAGCTA
jgi:transposase